MQRLGIGIELLLADKNQQIAPQVTCQKENQHQTRDRDEVFLPDRGIPDFAERTRRRIHEDIKRSSGSGVNINAADELTSSEKQFFVFFAPNRIGKTRPFATHRIGRLRITRVKASHSHPTGICLGKIVLKPLVAATPTYGARRGRVQPKLRDNDAETLPL